MARDTKAQQERILKRNERIRAEYYKLRDKRKAGVRLYSDEYVETVVAERFGLAVATIGDIISFKYENILQRRAEESKGDSNQLSIYDNLNSD